MAFTEETKQEIVTKLKTALKKCTPPLVIIKDTKDGMELIGNKPVPYGSAKKIVPGMYFASLIIRKDYLSFHFFPIYFAREHFEPIIPTFIKCLKGKTCFTIKKLEQVNEKELDALLKKGIEVFKKSGYML